MAAEPAADHGTEVEKMANSSSSWVLEVEKMLVDCTPSAAREQSINRVPEWLKNTNNIKAYRPMVMALGPFHHDDPNLKPMEEHKYRAVAHRLKKSGKPLQAYIDAIDDVAEQLQAAYGKDLGEEWQGENRHRFVEVMVRDGCFLLELINLGLENDDSVPESDDPFFGAHNYLYMAGTIVSDVLTMENQLPLLTLQRLLRVHYGTTPTTPTDENVEDQIDDENVEDQTDDENVEDQTDENINFRMLEFLGRCPNLDYVRHLPLGLHPLDLYHSSLTYGTRKKRTEEDPMVEIMPSAVEIHEAGIHFKTSKTDSLLDVDFQQGVLYMPKLTVDDDSEGVFLNLLAFEYLHAKAGNDVTAYVFFMDNIIDTAKDVSLLIAKGIFKNYLGSNEELAKLINDTLSKGAVIGHQSVINDVQQKVKIHCKKRWNRWRANFMHTYLSNPWVFISLVAASILLLAAVLQTVYTVVAFYLNK